MKIPIQFIALVVIAFLFNTCNRTWIHSHESTGFLMHELELIERSFPPIRCTNKSFMEFERENFPASNLSIAMAYEQTIETCFYPKGFNSIESEFHGKDYLSRYTFFRKHKRLISAEIQEVTIDGANNYEVYFDEEQRPFRFLKNDEGSKLLDFKTREITDVQTIIEIKKGINKNYERILIYSE